MYKPEKIWAKLAEECVGRKFAVSEAEDKILHFPPKRKEANLAKCCLLFLLVFISCSLRGKLFQSCHYIHPQGNIIVTYFDNVRRISKFGGYI